MLLTLSDRVDSFAQFMTVLLIFIFVLGITFFVTKWIGQIQKSQITGNNIEVVEATKISQNSFVEIVRIGGKYIAVAVSKENVTYLCDIPKEEISFTSSSTMSTTSFSSILDKVKNTIPMTEKNSESDGKDE